MSRDSYAVTIGEECEGGSPVVNIRSRTFDLSFDRARGVTEKAARLTKQEAAGLAAIRGVEVKKITQKKFEALQAAEVETLKAAKTAERKRQWDALQPPEKPAKSDG